MITSGKRWNMSMAEIRMPLILRRNHCTLQLRTYF